MGERRIGARGARGWLGTLTALTIVLGWTSTVEADDSFSAPTGALGANLSFDPSVRGRMHGEFSFHTQSQGGLTWTYLAVNLGFGVKVTDHLEFEASMPVGGALLSAAGGSSDQFGVGNLALQLNFFSQLAQLVRFKVGGGLSLGPWNQSNDFPTAEGAAVLLSRLATTGYEAPWQAYPGYVHLFVPARVEVGKAVRLTGDASLDAAIPTGNLEGGVLAQLAPGVAFWVNEHVDLGARLLLSIDSTELLLDSAQLSLEPYARFDFDRAFVSTRFTLNLDNPLGFSFDTGRLWGLSVALGGAF